MVVHELEGTNTTEREVVLSNPAAVVVAAEGRGASPAVRCGWASDSPASSAHCNVCGRPVCVTSVRGGFRARFCGPEATMEKGRRGDADAFQML